MKAETLKKSILQLAVEGKLVPQIESEGTARELLERIKEEKEQLIKDNKIKRDKNESVIYRKNGHYYERVGKKEPVCIDDEIPFDIPDSWEWARFGDATILRDSERIPLSSKEREKHIKKYDYYGASGVIDKVEKYIFDQKLLLIGEDGANLLTRTKPIAFIADGKYWVNNHAHVIECINDIVLSYVCWYINSISLAPYVTGTAQPKMNQTKMKSILLAIPPLMEQHRIVEKIEELLHYIEEYDLAEQELTKLNEEFPEKMKKSILQYAVEGKLVPQIESEGTARELLERIKEEKEQLIKDKKIKRDKNESVIYRKNGHYYERVGKKEPVCIDDEIPFDIPDNWEWCRISNIFQQNTGKALNSKNTEGLKLEYITTSNLYWNRFELDKLNKMFFKDSEIEKCTVTAGDLLVCEGGDIGRAAVWKYNFDMRIQNHIHKLRKYTSIDVDFYSYIFYLYKVNGIIGGKGIGIKGLSSRRIRNIIVPLPPLSEQHRIVERIEKILPLIEGL